MKQHHSLGSRIFDTFNYLVLMLYAFLAVIPIVYVISGSLTSSGELARKGFVIFPTEFSLSAYQYIFSTPTITRSFFVSVYITVVGTLINIVFTSMLAYPLAHKHIVGRKVIMSLITFTLLFSGGMIPGFIIVKNMGLMNSYWSLMIPGAINTFNLIVLKNFFQQIPAELEESARIDGANDLRILWKIILPLSAPALATFALFYSVGHWNSFFNAILYINDSRKWPIQVILRQIIMLSMQVGDSHDMSEAPPPAETIKMAVIVVATLPILLVYPFLQKHFTKGIMLGSVKG